VCGARTASSFDLDAPTLLAWHDVNVTLLRHGVTPLLVSCSERAYEREDKRDEKDQEQPIVDRHSADDREDDQQHDQKPNHRHASNLLWEPPTVPRYLAVSATVKRGSKLASSDEGGLTDGDTSR
jgi:ABC-type Zn2+ transport system substrate-binding protein/surface adhesin